MKNATAGQGHNRCRLCARPEGLPKSVRVWHG
ncbi:MAG: hypothetical protein IPM39_17405 [Chloroflexi bacterium]|nr:hypothetical protein [Chloroflexota bacterium]